MVPFQEAEVKVIKKYSLNNKEKKVKVLSDINKTINFSVQTYKWVLYKRVVVKVNSQIFPSRWLGKLSPSTIANRAKKLSNRIQEIQD